MKSELKLLTACIVLMLYLNFSTINAQILSDTASFTLLEKCVDNIYNFQFAEARELCNKINQKYPGHSGVYLLRGMITYWENYPLLPKSVTIKSYLDDMHLCIRYSERKNNSSREAENLLINLCARGMLLLFYSENDFSSEVIQLATSTYPHIRRSFNFASDYYDFNFFTGLYNYYREAYPEAYPIYKTFVFLFPRGNRQEGLRELQTAGRCSLVLKAESYSFLSWIYTNFERDYDLATSYSKMLHELYPDNAQYWTSYIKNLLLIKNYDEAEKLMNSVVPANKNTFIRAKLGIFNGILQEKKYHNPDLAFTLYEKGVKDISSFQSYGNEYAAYAYFGLSRISDLKGDKNYKKFCQKKATELAVFENVDFND
jgi:tetratricopeptide (TPR) repeat protein